MSLSDDDETKIREKFHRAMDQYIAKHQRGEADLDIDRYIEEHTTKSEVVSEMIDDLEEGGNIPKRHEGGDCQLPSTGPDKTDESDKEEKEDMFELEQDIYSIMYIADIKSRCLWWSLLVCATQLLILSLAITDMKKDAPENNKYKLPINVDMQVAVAQVVATVVMTLMQNDVFTSLDALIVVGYDASVAERFPHAIFAKWIISNLLRMLVGLLNLVAAFFIIVQADDVLDIFKDFAALHFITELDNAAFWLADTGYLGVAMHDAANDTKDIKLPHSRKRMKWLVWLAIAAILVLMLFGLGTVRSNQMSGYYLKLQSAHNLTVSFGDEVYVLPEDTEFIFGDNPRSLWNFNETDPPDLHYAYFSGNYQLSSNGDKPDMHDERPIYYERNATMCETDPTCGMFYYCSYAGAWVFTIPALNNALQQLGPDECKWGWLALSANTDAFKLEDVPTTGWKIWTGVMKETDMLSIVNDACRGPADCSFHGKCWKGKCYCDGDWEGKKCDIDSYCPALWWIDYGDSSSDYQPDGPYFLLTDEDGAFTSYERPIYINRQENSSFCFSGYELNIVLYAGRRWFDTMWCDFDYVSDGGKITKDGKKFFGEDLHAYWGNILESSTNWFSEPSTSESPSGLAMFQILDSGSKGSNFLFGANFLTKATYECMDVSCEHDRRICGSFGKCAEENYEDGEITFRYHYCLCSKLFGGFFCQFSPYDSYVIDQYNAYNMSLSGNGTDYSPNEYHKLFWSVALQNASSNENEEL